MSPITPESAGFFQTTRELKKAGDVTGLAG